MKKKLNVGNDDPFSVSSYINSTKTSIVFQKKLKNFFSNKNSHRNDESLRNSITDVKISMEKKKDVSESSIIKKSSKLSNKLGRQEINKKNYLAELMNSISSCKSVKSKSIQTPKSLKLNFKFNSMSYDKIMDSLSKPKESADEQNAFIKMKKAKEAQPEGNVFHKLKKESAKERIDTTMIHIYNERVKGLKISRSIRDHDEKQKVMPSPVLFQLKSEKRKTPRLFQRHKSCLTLDMDFCLNFNVPLKEEAAKENKRYQEYMSSKGKENSRKRTQALDDWNKRRDIRFELTARSMKQIRTCSSSIERIYLKNGFSKIGKKLEKSSSHNIVGKSIPKVVSFFNAQNSEPTTISNN